MYKVRVWDLPTRVFHWSLTVCIVGLITTGQIGGEAMPWHFRLGYATWTLLLFRLAWGFVGGRWSRFAHFVAGPTAIVRYLKGLGERAQEVGHNPLGALSVLALLLVPLMQVATGLISDDEIATSGPLAKWAPNSWVSAASFYHGKVGKLLLLALVALHIGAIAFYKLRKHQDLLSPMVHGDKQLPAQFEPSRDDRATWALAGLVFALCAASVASILVWLG